MRFILALARVFLFLVARGTAWIPALDRKYRMRVRLDGPWCDAPDGCGDGHLWLHGASLGECKMLLSLARALRQDWPGCPEILLTTQKAEAVAVLADLASGLCKVSVAPADLPGTLRKFMERVNPVALVLGENELWPGFVSAMKSAGRKVALVSGRVYRKPIGVDVNSLDFVAMQEDCGNWKLLDWARGGGVDGCFPDLPRSGDIGVSFISFHKEELSAFCKLALKAVAARKSVVLAPRRLEEVGLFAEALKSLGVEVVFWPQVKESAVTLVDRFGAVPEILGNSKAAVVGGSFDKRLGVHDFWEPLCAGVQTFVGPYSNGAVEAVARLVESGALLQVLRPEDFGFRDVPANGFAIKFALQGQRQKILNSYGRLLKFLSGDQ